jgi:hypothetical protein
LKSCLLLCVPANSFFAYLRPKAPNLCIFWRALEWKCFYISWPLEIVYVQLVFYGPSIYVFCDHLVYISPFGYVVPRKFWQTKTPLRYFLQYKLQM